MENEPILNPDNLNGTDEETVIIPEGESAEDKALRLEVANKKLFARLKETQGFKQDAEGKWIKPEKTIERKPLQTAKPEESFVKDIAELKLAEKKRQFGYKNGLSPEETDKLFRYAGDTNPDEVLKDPFFQSGLKEFRRTNRVQDAIPSSSNRSTKVDGKTFAEMTSEERSKNWDKITKK